MSVSILGQHLEHYSTWRARISQQLHTYQIWLKNEEISDWQIDLRLKTLQDRLAEDKLNLAFVAEFSRGKSELINAIFFADYKQRLLPSAAGRTTMCPTELLYDASRPPSIQLLPIASRVTSTSLTDFKRYPEEWVTHLLDLDSAESMTKTLGRVSETLRVTPSQAERLGMFRSDDPNSAFHLDSEGFIEIPSWRHAIINFPHPLLKQGLVVLDTPGLNAIGTEPELTLNLIPNAHAVLFLLAADTGVTKSDIEIWRDHIAKINSNHRGHWAVLNKIDGLWDDLKSQSKIDAEIQKQILSTGHILNLPIQQILPVSAQKGLLAKITHDAALLVKSGLPALELALSTQLIPSKQDIVRESTASEINELILNAQHLLKARVNNVNEQLSELVGLRGKNQDVIQQMMLKVEAEQKQFEMGLQQFHALRSIFTKHSNELLSCLDLDTLKKDIIRTRTAMEKSRFSKGLTHAMNTFFLQAKQNFSHANAPIKEISEMMTAMYRKFERERELEQTILPTYSTFNYAKKLGRLEENYQLNFNTVLNLLTTEQHSLSANFFETLASRVVALFDTANQDAENWLKAIMSPMETQVREHKLHLRRRLESIKRIHQATDTLEGRISELLEAQNGIQSQLSQLAQMQHAITEALWDATRLDQAAA